MTPPSLLLAGLLAPLAAPNGADAPPAIDFSAVPRTLEREPAYVGEPRYGMFLFGAEADHRMWAVLDRSANDVEGYDVLWLDLDADGVLGEDGERFAGEQRRNSDFRFTIGDLVQPGTQDDERPVVHTEFQLTWTPASVRYSMQWRGEERTRGGFGPRRETYAGFGASASDATIYVPGFDRPLEFEHWMSGELTAGKSSSFKVFVGARGSERGAFSCADQDFLPEDEYVLATLLYTDADGQAQRHQVKLRERC